MTLFPAFVLLGQNAEAVDPAETSRLPFAARLDVGRDGGGAQAEKRVVDLLIPVLAGVPARHAQHVVGRDPDCPRHFLAALDLGVDEAGEVDQDVLVPDRRDAPFTGRNPDRDISVLIGDRRHAAGASGGRRTETPLSPGHCEGAPPPSSRRRDQSVRPEARLPIRSVPGLRRAYIPLSSRTMTLCPSLRKSEGVPDSPRMAEQGVPVSPWGGQSVPVSPSPYAYMRRVKRLPRPGSGSSYLP